MNTPILSDDKSDNLSTDISLDFSKFETDSMLNSSYNPDRDSDRSPDPTCLHLQSPLDLSITTSFENALSDCGVAGFDPEAGKTSYSFSNSVNSTESDAFVHLDEALPIDTLSKSHISSTLSRVIPSSNIVSNPPVILGSIGAANFVTAVLNKNMNRQQILNNIILPSTPISLNSPGILVLNPCTLTSGIVNLMPSISRSETSLAHPPASLINMCPPPIKSILSLLTANPQNLSTKQSFTSPLCSHELSSLTETSNTPMKLSTGEFVGNNQKDLVADMNTIFPNNNNNIEDDISTKHEQSEDNFQPKLSNSSQVLRNIIDVSDIADDQNDDDDTTLVLSSGNISDEVDGAVDSDKRPVSIPRYSDGQNISNSGKLINSCKVQDSNIDNLTSLSHEPQITMLPSSDIVPGELQDISRTILGKTQRRYNNREAKKKEDIILKCDLCSAKFSKSGNYHRHKKIHTICTEAEDTRYPCSHCGRKFIQKCDLKRHVLIHMKQEPFRCDVCDKGYVRQSDLKVHKRFHTRERTHPCDSCNKTFFQSGDLNRHKRNVHNNTPSLTCGHCKRNFAKETTLIRHMQSSHRELILQSLNEKLQTPSIISTPGSVMVNTEEASVLKVINP